MPIEDLQQAAQKIAGFLNTLNKLGGMRLKYRISAGDVARDAEGGEARQMLNVELAGPDVPLVIQHNGELLRALETLASQMLRLDHHEHHLVSFDAANFKALARPGAATGRRNRRGEGAAIGNALQFSAHEQPRSAHDAYGVPGLQGVETASVGEGLQPLSRDLSRGQNRSAGAVAGQAERLWSRSQRINGGSIPRRFAKNASRARSVRARPGNPHSGCRSRAEKGALDRGL